MLIPVSSKCGGRRRHPHSSFNGALARAAHGLPPPVEKGCAAANLITAQAKENGLALTQVFPGRRAGVHASGALQGPSAVFAGLSFDACFATASRRTRRGVWTVCLSCEGGEAP